MSSQILREREGYYEVLEETQKGSGDITAWLKWFLACAGRSMAGSETLLARVLARATFWRRHPEIPARMNERQLKVLNRLLEAGPGGFEGGISTRKYAGLARTSKSTASRELAELVALGLLAPRPGGGRSASYEIAWS
jgi:Fic family protein